MYIAIDLEFNQFFKFHDGNCPPDNKECKFEIMQIGAIKLDEDGNNVEEMNLFIKPTIYPRIHPFVRKITGLKKSDFSGKPTFLEVSEAITCFMGKDDVFLVWGDGDLSILYNNLKFYNISDENMPKKFINVQKLTAAHLKQSTAQAIGLKNAIEKLEIETEIPFHNAFNDAIYTARIFNIVKGDESKIKINQYTAKSPKEKIMKSNEQVDFAKLYTDLQKDLGRVLTKKEKRLVREAYGYGKLQKFG